MRAGFRIVFQILLLVEKLSSSRSAQCFVDVGLVLTAVFLFVTSCFAGFLR